MNQLKIYVISGLLALLLPLTASAQNVGTIKGVVVDEQEEPLIGATVKMKGQATGVVTDINGEYTFRPSVSQGTVVVSYVGYASQEYDLARFSRLKRIVMKADGQMLDDVVVTGMQKMDKRLFTGSTTKIDAKTAKIDGVADLSRSLEGHAAGVSVQNVSGTFGAAPRADGHGQPLRIGVYRRNTSVGADTAHLSPLQPR